MTVYKLEVLYILVKECQIYMANTKLVHFMSLPKYVVFRAFVKLAIYKLK